MILLWLVTVISLRENEVGQIIGADFETSNVNDDLTLPHGAQIASGSWNQCKRRRELGNWGQ